MQDTYARQTLKDKHCPLLHIYPLPAETNLQRTSILKVLHGNTKSPTGCMCSWRYNILLEVKKGS